MKPTDLIEAKRSDRAVSPVIGVILMVAITVILAAVIGAFVLEIGDNQETAPSTSFDSSEEKISVPKRSTNPNGDYIDAPNVGLTVAGGETLRISQVRVSHQGRPNVWGLQNGEVNRAPNAVANTKIKTDPATSPCPTLGTNDVVTWDAGQTEYASFSAGDELLNLNNPNDGVLVPKHDKINEPSAWNSGWGSTSGDPNPCNGNHYVVLNSFNGPTEVRGEVVKEGAGRMAANIFAGVLDEGHSVSVRWQSKSGGKSQKLFDYEVQSSSGMAS